MIHQELSETIIGEAMKVLNALKPGLNEKAYENALVIELSNTQTFVGNASSAKAFPIHVNP